MLIRLVKNTFGPERFPILFFWMMYCLMSAWMKPVKGGERNFTNVSGSMYSIVRRFLKPSIRSTGMSGMKYWSIIIPNVKNRIRVRSNPCGSIWLPVPDYRSCWRMLSGLSEFLHGWPVLPIGTTNGAIITGPRFGQTETGILRNFIFPVNWTMPGFLPMPGKR